MQHAKLFLTSKATIRGIEREYIACITASNMSNNAKDRVQDMTCIYGNPDYYYALRDLYWVATGNGFYRPKNYIKYVSFADFPELTIDDIPQPFAKRPVGSKRDGEEIDGNNAYIFTDGDNQAISTDFYMKAYTPTQMANRFSLHAFGHGTGAGNNECSNLSNIHCEGGEFIPWMVHTLEGNWPIASQSDRLVMMAAKIKGNTLFSYFDRTKLIKKPYPDYRSWFEVRFEDNQSIWAYYYRKSNDLLKPGQTEFSFDVNFWGDNLLKQFRLFKRFKSKVRFHTKITQLDLPTHKGITIMGSRNFRNYGLRDIVLLYNANPKLAHDQNQQYKDFIDYVEKMNMK